MPAPVFNTSYLTLPNTLYQRTAPSPVSAPSLIALNTSLAETLGLDPAWLASPEALATLAGNAVPPTAASIATAYAGHQFGHFVPQLGDGRALLLGEILTPTGQRLDIQLKGAGPTPYSRNGDGRAALGPVLREYIVSEAMAALAIPTTRALAAIRTGDYVFRDDALPGAILARVASSHIRVGTFQFAAAQGDASLVQALADHVIARHYPDAASAENPYQALLAGVVAAQANLVARWLLVGFIHGVMNTDNCAIAGETIDYGPCAFMDEYHPGKVFSSIDRGGRYAYANQPHILQWNLARLAECLLPLLAPDEDSAIAAATAALENFATIFKHAYFSGLTQKIGLTGTDPEDVALAQSLLDLMAAGEADFTLTFRSLANAIHPAGAAATAGLFKDPSGFAAWAEAWRARLARTPQNPTQTAAAMNAVNPAYIPRNHLIETAIQAALQGDDAPFHALNATLARPFDETPDRAAYAQPPRPAERVQRTFCGT